MKNKLLIFIAFLGIISLFACEKDETKAVLDATPTAPVLDALADIVLKRDNPQDTIIISGTNADFGYQASVEHILEAAVAGSDFDAPIQLASEQENSFTFTVSSLNALLTTALPEDEQASLELRVRALIVSSGTGGSATIESESEALAVKITTYGPPSLYVTDDINNQRLVSAADDGIYVGWIYTDGTSFTFTNRDDDKVYGQTGGVVSEGGAAVVLEAGGYDIEVNLNTSVFKSEDVTIGIIGDAVGSWDNDIKMTYDFSDKTWNINQVVTAGGIKFRSHNSWAAVNVAYDPDGHDLNNLYQSTSEADSENIDNISPGTYDIKLSLETTPMWVTFTPAK